MWYEKWWAKRLKLSEIGSSFYVAHSILFSKTILFSLFIVKKTCYWRHMKSKNQHWMPNYAIWHDINSCDKMEQQRLKLSEIGSLFKSKKKWVSWRFDETNGRFSLIGHRSKKHNWKTALNYWMDPKRKKNCDAPSRCNESMFSMVDTSTFKRNISRKNKDIAKIFFYLSPIDQYR